jgi:hypothetical protein
LNGHPGSQDHRGKYAKARQKVERTPRNIFDGREYRDDKDSEKAREYERESDIPKFHAASSKQVMHSYQNVPFANT